MDVFNAMWNWSTPTTDTVFQGEAYDEDGNAVPRRYMLGYGAKQPTFALPPSFKQRLGKTPAEFHFSGTYEADGRRIGYLRLPNFSPPASAINELDAEIQYFNENTDGMVVDVSRNTGGGCYMLEVARRLMRNEFWFFGEEVRPTWDRMQNLSVNARSRTAGEPERLGHYVAFAQCRSLARCLSLRFAPHRTDSCLFVPAHGSDLVSPAGGESLVQASDRAGRRVFDISGRYLCGYDAGQQPRTSGRHPHKRRGKK